MNPSHQTTHGKVRAGPHARRSPRAGKALIDAGSSQSFVSRLFFESMPTPVAASLSAVQRVRERKRSGFNGTPLRTGNVIRLDAQCFARLLGFQEPRLTVFFPIRCPSLGMIHSMCDTSDAQYKISDVRYSKQTTSLYIYLMYGIRRAILVVRYQQFDMRRAIFGMSCCCLTSPVSHLRTRRTSPKAPLPIIASASKSAFVKRFRPSRMVDRHCWRALCYPAGGRGRQINTSISNIHNNQQTPTSSPTIPNNTHNPYRTALLMRGSGIKHLEFDSDLGFCTLQN